MPKSITQNTVGLPHLEPFRNPELVILRNPVAKARFGFSLIQQKFMLEVLAWFKSNPESKVAQFNVREYFNKLGITSNNIKEYIREIEEMRCYDIRIPTGSKSKGGIHFVGTTLFASVEYSIGEDRSGTIEVEISEKLRPFFLDIANGEFFSYHIQNTRSLKSTYSIKLYLLLKSYSRLGKLHIDLAELRSILEIGEDEYRQYPDFRKRVLERAHLEMAEKTDTAFDYKEIRAIKGNSKSPIVSITFTIKKNPKGKALALPETIAGAERIKTNLGSQNPVESSADGEAARAILTAMRWFDSEQTETYITQYLQGLDAENEQILDALHYARNQKKISNIYAYLPTILKTNAGQGLAEKARTKVQRQQEKKAQAAEQLKEALERLERLESDRRAAANEIIRDLTAADAFLAGEAVTKVMANTVVRQSLEAQTGLVLDNHLPMDTWRESKPLRDAVLRQIEFMQPKAFKAVKTQFDGSISKTRQIIETLQRG